MDRWDKLVLWAFSLFLLQAIDPTPIEELHGIMLAIYTAAAFYFVIGYPLIVLFRPEEQE